MKWRNLSSRFWKKLVIISVFASVQILTNTVNFDRRRQLLLNKTEPQLRQDLQQLDEAAVFGSHLMNVDTSVDRRFCQTSVSGDEKFVDEVTFIVDPGKRLGYCHVPKVASSSWYKLAS